VYIDVARMKVIHKLSTVFLSCEHNVTLKTEFSHFVSKYPFPIAGPNEVNSGKP
jgi:hypothetical protein